MNEFCRFYPCLNSGESPTNQIDMPLVKSVYKKLNFLFLNLNIFCGYSKERSQ